LMLAVVGLICGAAGYVISSNKNNETKTSSDQKTDSKTASSSVTDLQPGTSDNKEQIKDLITVACSGNSQGAQAAIDKAENLNIDGVWAGIGVSCDEEGGGYYAYLKKTDNKWGFFLKTQDTPPCDKFDGTGVSLKILPKCYDLAINQERAPK
jgi:hypothetical protein